MRFNAIIATVVSIFLVTFFLWLKRIHWHPRSFFQFLIGISVLFPIYSTVSMVKNIAHNQWAFRAAVLRGSAFSESPDLDLTNDRLAALDQEVARAYKGSVFDGERLGRGYHRLWIESLLLDILLFVAGLMGLIACRERKPAVLVK